MKLVVVNKGDHSVGWLDLASGEAMASVDTGCVTPHEVALSPDGAWAFAPTYGDSGVGQPGTDGASIAVVNLRAGRLAGEIDLGRGLRPHGAVLCRKTGLVYVTTELENSLTVIDPENLKVIGCIPTGQDQSHMVAVSHDGKRAYTANVGPGTVSVLDLEARRTLQVIPVSGWVQRISINPDSSLVFTADQIAPQMAVLDTRTNSLARWIALPAKGFGSAVTPDGRYLLVTLPAVQQLAVVDLDTFEVCAVVSVPASPQSVVVTPDGGTAYVSCDQSSQVAEISVIAMAVTRLIGAGTLVDGLALTN